MKARTHSDFTPSDDLEDNHWHREKEAHGENQLDNNPERLLSLVSRSKWTFVRMASWAALRTTTMSVDRQWQLISGIPVGGQTCHEVKIVERLRDSDRD